jgi:hypothetical protein
VERSAFQNKGVISNPFIFPVIIPETLYFPGFLFLHAEIFLSPLSSRSCHLSEPD